MGAHGTRGGTAKLARNATGHGWSRLGRSLPPSVAGLLRRTGALPAGRRSRADWWNGPCSGKQHILGHGRNKVGRGRERRPTGRRDADRCGRDARAPLFSSGCGVLRTVTTGHKEGGEGGRKRRGLWKPGFWAADYKVNADRGAVVETPTGAAGSPKAWSATVGKAPVAADANGKSRRNNSTRCDA